MRSVKIRMRCGACTSKGSVSIAKGLQSCGVDVEDRVSLTSCPLLRCLELLEKTGIVTVPGALRFLWGSPSSLNLNCRSRSGSTMTHEY